MSYSRTRDDELEIIGLAAGGDGIARSDGLVVFVPRTAPGDIVHATVSSHGRFARGIAGSILKSSDSRIDAPCVHFTRDNCGGCQWQHIDIHAQRKAKAQLVADAFQRIAHSPIDIPIVFHDENIYSYRRTISFTIRGRGRGRIGGFRADGNPDILIPVTDCMLAHPAIQEAWSVIQMRLHMLPEVKSVGKANPRFRGRRSANHLNNDDIRLSIRLLRSGKIAVVVAGGRRWSESAISEFSSGIPGCDGVWWQSDISESRLVWEPKLNASLGIATDNEFSDGLEKDVAMSFVQVNAGVADILHAHVERIVLSQNPKKVIDAYSGSGRLSISLSNKGINIVSLERDVAASTWCSNRLPEGSEAIPGSVEDTLGDCLPADIVVLNPPRAGVAVEVAKQLSGDGVGGSGLPSLLIYISCDPATLARDVSRLKGWQISSVECFDMFPQTSHVETVCVLKREGL